jgi:hypothetical protein
VVFLVGIDGFAMFAPYVVVLFLTGYIVSRLRKTAQPSQPAIAAESAALV